MSVPKPTQPIQNHEMSVTLAPDEGTEIKVSMSKGGKVEYSWQTDGGKANFDVHADSKKLTNPKILIPVLIIVAVLIVIAISGMIGGEVVSSDDHGHPLLYI